MSYNILVVDDSTVVRKMIARALEASGLPVGEVYHAHDGEQALVVLREHWVDLVLTDINMPNMTGMELVEVMANDELLRDIPVAVVSTEGSHERIATLKEQGICGYLRKPFAPEDIKELVAEALGGDR